MDFYKGEIILINKPLRWTSFDAVKKTKNILQQYSKTHHVFSDGKDKARLKIGHAGTLDPLATGLLILCTGGLTRQVEHFRLMEKEYTGSFLLGATTPSFDLETAMDQQYPTDHITPGFILETAQKFLGTLPQVPPLHSAVKIDGKRAYTKARRGHVFDIKQRIITISEFEITGIEMPLVSFRVVCSTGTYIRSLASDFGKALSSGACLNELCRIRIGGYVLDNALTPEQLERKLLAS